jgi:hypothetical protein
VLARFGLLPLFGLAPLALVERRQRLPKPVSTPAIKEPGPLNSGE